MALTTLGKKPVGSIVKIRENGKLVDFYVAKHDYESGLNGAGRTLVVRKYVGRDDYSQWNSIRQNTYAGSTVDGWLNSAYKSRLDSSTLSLIGSTKFPYTPGNGNYALSTLSRPIFLLSAYELGKSTEEASQISEFNLEGSPLPIASTLQVSHIEGALGDEVANQWTRTPTTKETFSEYLNKKAVYLDINGKSNSTYTTNKCQNRPAFTLPSTLYVLEDGTVAENTAPTAPGSINVPQNIKGGASITLSWTVSTDKEGSISWYELEASRGGQSWQQIYKGPETWAKYTVPAGTTTIAFRVRSVDNDGAKSGYTTSKTETVYNNKGPSAPGSIKATNVVQGETATITITAATDPDGTVARYVYERSVNGGGWTSLKETTALAVTDAIGSWKTVAYRAKAVDNEGVFGPYATTSQLTVDKPPTAPKSIQVANAIKGETATITITAATDPDGTIASYRYQRSVDGGGWVQFADANALTQTDQIQDGWGTVAYRAQAVDDVGAAGPFVTSDTFTITSGLLMIGGPVSNLGIRAASFSLALSIGVSGQTGVTDIQMKVRVDQNDIYEGRVKQNDVITIPIDTRPMGSGRHEIYVILEKSDYNAAASYFVFTVPSVALPAGGSAQVFQDSSGSPVFPLTSARYVIGEGNKSVQTQLNELRTAHRGRTGHLGFVDAVLGPASKYQIPREKDVLYVSMIFNAPAGSGGGLFSIPPGFSGEVGGENGKITASETSLTIDLPANGVVSISQYAVDSSPQGAPDISALFVALENPKVESANTNNTTAATGLVDALRQIDAAYPSFNKYALSSAAGDITYFVASPGTIQPSTKTAVVAYVASDHPTTWYSNATMKFSEVSP